MNGQLLLIDKPLGWTSFDVVGYMRRLLREHRGLKKIKIGHAGTLDPLATGLLIICTGKFTKRINEFIGLEKEYTGTFYLGATRPSYDRETDIDHTFPTDHLTPELIRQTAATFIGAHDQIPPQYSATKIKGVPAYLYARGKQEVTLESKPIVIIDFEVTAIRLPEVDFRIVCSKGTYIRAIARDYGQSLSSGAYLDSLSRIRIGTYHLRDAVQQEELFRMLSENKTT